MAVKTSSMTGTISERLNAALILPNGARFYRCALQINPFAYLSRHSKQTSFRTEADYNAAIIAGCQEAGIEVIGITDHYRVEESVGLVQTARAAGLFAFSGFEAVTKDGVHFLCLFDPNKDNVLERFIGECGIHDTSVASPTGSLDSSELLGCAKKWGAVCIAAHVAAEGGLLKKLSGQPRVNVWKSPELLACALAGPIEDAPEGIRPILENKGGEYYRDRPVAVINASDINSPEDLNKDSTSCFIKMSTVSVEALRQAFLDPESRIRLNSDPQPEPHAELLAITWETNGFMGDTSVHFNGNLNVLVGGRGTGKSTMIESIRYALGLDPIGEEARKAHEGVIRHVLCSGTKVSLLVRSHKPSQRCYTIERSVPNPPIVKDEAGAVLTLSPRDVMPGVEVFGQHEISELTK
ncbi:MAG: ATP-binding protein, partial [Rhodocyclaceae bacterium]|nr:ATP-binding protein [Rhodocyclaceae bacterium]